MPEMITATDDQSKLLQSQLVHICGVGNQPCRAGLSLSEPWLATDLSIVSIVSVQCTATHQRDGDTTLWRALI